MPHSNRWLTYSLIHILFVGVWGALIEIPEKNGFPPTLGYVVWALGMIPVAAIALKLKQGKLNTSKQAVISGLAIGLLGSGGQMVLFLILKLLPAYLVFPVLSLTPMLTIVLAVILLGEKAGRLGWTGIGMAIISIFILSYQPGGGSGNEYTGLILLALIPMAAWGVQGYIMRWASRTVDAEDIFFYMTLSALLLVPLAIGMTDFTQPVNWGADGGILAFFIQLLNAIGALCLVYAFRYGKAILVAPITTALSPVLTVGISLLIYRTIPQFYTWIGIILALVAAVPMSISEAKGEPGS